MPRPPTNASLQSCSYVSNPEGCGRSKWLYRVSQLHVCILQRIVNVFRQVCDFREKRLRVSRASTDASLQSYSYVLNPEGCRHSKWSYRVFKPHVCNPRRILQVLQEVCYSRKKRLRVSRAPTDASLQSYSHVLNPEVCKCSKWCYRVFNAQGRVNNIPTI